MEFFTLRNIYNTEVTLSNIGASIYDIRTVDQNDKLESILLTTKDKDDFNKETSFLGKTIGRTGGRISDSQFILNDKKYIINSKDPNGLHGGVDTLGYKEFDYEEISGNDYIGIRFSYYSKDMESGYPGNCDIVVEYKLYNKANKLVIGYIAKSDKDTLMNLSNHAYFNLSGNCKDKIFEHELFINSTNYVEIKNALPVGINKVDEIYDFKNKHNVGKYLFDKEIIDNTNGYDFPYLLDDVGIEHKGASLVDPKSKRRLDIYTTYPCVVLYTCNYIDNKIGNNGKVMEPYSAVCLECMYVPNSINNSFIDEKKDILRANHTYNEAIELCFGLEE